MTTVGNTLKSCNYRLILIVPESRQVLISRTDDGDCLPSVRIPRGLRVARELQAAIYRAFKIHTIILHLLAPDEGEPLYAVAELFARQKPLGLWSVDMAHLMTWKLGRAVLQRLRFLANGDSCSDSPFSKIGWLDEAIAWVEAETGSMLASKNQVEQYNAGEGFTLIRFCMEDQSEYWLKATGEPNTHELPVTDLLSRLAQEYLPRVVAWRPAWNAWLTVGYETLSNERNIDRSQMMGDAIQSMASLQLKTIGYGPNLLEAGAFDQSMAHLRQRSEVLFDFIEESMRQPTSSQTKTLGASRLRELRVIFEDFTRRMEDLDFPQTILHGDMHWGNILTGPDRCRFLDWSEAYVGCPLITLQHLLLMDRGDDPGSEGGSVSLLKEKFKRVWLPVCEPELLEEGFMYMDFLAAVSALYGRGDWLNLPGGGGSGRQRYARSLAHHMDRAAREPSLQSALRSRSF